MGVTTELLFMSTHCVSGLLLSVFYSWFLIFTITVQNYRHGKGDSEMLINLLKSIPLSNWQNQVSRDWLGSQYLWFYTTYLFLRFFRFQLLRVLKASLYYSTDCVPDIVHGVLDYKPTK